MKINKLISALGNVKQIAEGIKNKVFKNDDVEAIAQLRWNQCAACPSLDNIGSFCAVPGAQPCCKDCGCALGFKLRSLSTECPKGKWKAVMDPASEQQLKEQIKENKDASNI